MIASLWIGWGPFIVQVALPVAAVLGVFKLADWFVPRWIGLGRSHANSSAEQKGATRADG